MYHFPQSDSYENEKAQGQGKQDVKELTAGKKMVEKTLDDDQTCLDRLENEKIARIYELAASKIPQEIKLQQKTIVSLGQKISKLRSQKRYNDMTNNEVQIRLLLNQTQELKKNLEDELKKKNQQKEKELKKLQGITKQLEQIKKRKQNNVKIQILNQEIKQIEELEKEFEKETMQGDQDGKSTDKIKGMATMVQTHQRLKQQNKSLTVQIEKIQESIKILSKNLKIQNHTYHQLQEQKIKLQEELSKKVSQKLREEIKIQKMRNNQLTRSSRTLTQQSSSSAPLEQKTVKKQQPSAPVQQKNNNQYSLINMKTALLMMWTLALIIYQFYKE